ncbi:MAG: bifunctional oligoribonuclease/PAP phosphatase NrnA [Bacteroidia bacterium]|nr:MAG: bifunctional oligoribonuclease/PAP phosphatase NrnA [Bacteroidia bacterium]
MGIDILEKERIKKLQSLLENKEQRVAIVAHTNPDGDAIGSSLGFYGYLKQKGFHHIDVIVPSGYASFLHWMPGNDDVRNATDDPENTLKIIAQANLIICLDFNGFGRAEQLEKPLQKSTAVKVMIDHHPDPEDGFDLVISDTSVSSTAELVYRCIDAMGDDTLVTREIAECLYAGIVTDTGSFSYACNNPVTYEIVARLIGKGVDGAYLHRLIYSTYTENRMRLLGYSLSEKLQVIPEAHTAFISLTKKDLERFHHREGDTEGLVNYALDIKDIRLAALFMEKEDYVKASFRSVGKMDVNRLARNYYNGGGHVNAAGGKSYLSMNDTLEAFIALVKKGFD